MNCDLARVLMADYWNQHGTEHRMPAGHDSGDALAIGGSREMEALEQHLGECRDCRREVVRLGDLWRGLGDESAAGLEPLDSADSAAMRDRFYETLAAYREGLVGAAPLRESRGARLFAGSRDGDRNRGWLPGWPHGWQVAAGIALLVAGWGAGWGTAQSRAPELAATFGDSESDVASLRQEVADMRQLVALSLLREQSASERLRGVSWAYRAAPSATDVQAALIDAVNHDPNVNVRLAAADALRAFAGTSETSRAVVESLPRQDAPLVQVALIDLMLDLQQTGGRDASIRAEAASELRRLAASEAIDGEVKQRAQWALERLPGDGVAMPVSAPLRIRPLHFQQ